MFVRLLTLWKHVINKYIIKPNTAVVLKEYNLKKKGRRKKNLHSPAKFCPKFYVVRSWRQWDGRVQRLVIFVLLTLQVLVPRQFTHVSRSVNVDWGFRENRLAVIALSQIFKLLKPLKILRNFVYRAIKRYKELRGVEDRARSGRLKSVRAEAAIKTVRERIRQNPLRKQKIMSRELNISIQSSRASSGTIYEYTWERTSAQRDTSLLLLWRRSDGQEQSVSSSGTPRTGTKTSSSWTKHFSPSKSSRTTRTKIFILKRPLRCTLRVQGCHHTSHFMVWWEVSHQVVTRLHFCKNGVKVVSQCIKRTCYKVLWNSLTWPSSVVRWVFQEDSALAQKPRRLRSDCGGTFRPLSAQKIGPRGVQTSSPGL